VKKRTHLRTAALVVAGIVLALLGILAYVHTPASEVGSATLRTIHLKGESVRISVADTDALRQLGLGGRAGLAPDEGMLFVFPRDGKYAFWMKDMRFSIDILWLSAPSTSSGQATVVYIAQNISPDTYPKDFVSTAPARYVLELPAGYAASHSIKVGDIVQL